MLFSLVLSAVLLTAAGEPMPETVTERDLLFDVGAREERTGLDFGWSRRERSGERTYRWIKRLEADVWFDVAAASDMDLWVSAAPFHIPQQRQSIGVYVNNRFVAEWVCPDGPGYEDYHARIPAAAVKEGRNRLTLRVGYRRRPPGDKRELALAVERILLRVRSE